MGEEGVVNLHGNLLSHGWKAVHSTLQGSLTARDNNVNPLLCPRCSITRPKINVDNKTRFSYPEGYWLCEWVLQYVGL